ncbi:MAG TPA: ankyrin repeat domain-containing protein [Blastocatellia bacterium]|nr:ankyrin repeat domain-containing protein [Blastocatellia bacterium]
MPRLRFLCLLLPLLALPVYAQDINEELLVATRKSDVEKVKALLAKGADVNAKSPYGATPLFFACDRGNVEVIKVLLEHGADVNTKDKFYGATPLGWALNKGKPEVIRLLVEKGAKEKEMAMNFGVSGGHTGVVKAALDQGGFKQESLDKYLSIATRKRHAEVAEMLRKAGAKETPPYTVDAETLKLYEGLFKNDNFSMVFKIKDGKLVGTANGSDSVMVPVREHVFEDDDDGSTVTFMLTDGKVTGLTLKFTNGALVLKKGEAK